MSLIEEALNELNAAIDRLDASAQGQQQTMETLKLRINQQELFQQESTKTNGHSKPEQLSLDPAIIVQKLDSTIEKMETILREG